MALIIWLLRLLLLSLKNEIVSKLRSKEGEGFYSKTFTKEKYNRATCR